MKNIYKNIGLLIIPLLCFALSSCEKDNYDPNPAEGDFAHIISIKVKVGGLELQGKINENRKEIIFPRLPGDTDLSVVSFSGELPAGAAFESQTYDFTPDEGSSSAKKTIKVINNNRFKEYYVTLSLTVPPVGAGFLNPPVYNFSAGAGGTVYPSFSTATSARVADMDLKHVLVVGRDLSPHLLLLDELKQGIINPIALDQGGVVGGGGANRNTGRLIDGNVYIGNLTVSFMAGSNPDKVYHWNTESPELPPTVIAEYRAADIIGTPEDRYGDMMSIDLDENGDGYIFLKGNNLPSFLRIKVSNFTTTSEPTVIFPGTSLGGWAAYNGVEGASGEYLYTGHQGPMRLVNAGGSLQYTLPVATLANPDGVGARVITFNGARYLLAMNNILINATIAVYDITRGESTQEALEIFNAADAALKAPVFLFPLAMALPAGNAAVQISWAKDGNDKLYIIGSGVQAGFTIAEFLQATDTDPFDSMGEDDGYVIRTE
ncbi:MAG: DUF4623 domain-containing protein [Bacteroidales bacterium]|nr:DUF4623 domain-containing protein [Bacteroidales bacterium]